MKILVTGGAGYIGSILVPRLLKEGYEVIVLDNLMYKQTPLLDCCNAPLLETVIGDIRDRDLMFKLIDRSDIIIHLASIVGVPACIKDPTAAKTVIHDSIWNILDARERNQPVFYPNTNSGYGLGQGSNYCDESTEIKPISLYGELKIEVEKIILNCQNTISLRLATVFGVSPRMRVDLLVNDFVEMAVNQGYIELSEKNFKRNYIHVRDVARAFVHCLTNFDQMKGHAYNVGLSDANLSKLELCEEIKKQIPQLRIYENEIRKDPDQRNYIVSNAKIEATGFKPQVSLQEGITELIKCYQIIKTREFRNA